MNSDAKREGGSFQVGQTYTGPLVVLKDDELSPLEELLHIYPRPWNADLRRRLKAAITRQAIDKAKGADG